MESLETSRVKIIQALLLFGSEKVNPYLLYFWHKINHHYLFSRKCNEGICEEIVHRNAVQVEYFVAFPFCKMWFICPLKTINYLQQVVLIGRFVQ